MQYLFFLSVVLLPNMSFAQGLVTCHEAGTCSFCRLLQMINGIVEWLIITAVLFTFLIMAYAGVLLIFSRGDAAALQKGKQLFFQTLIGILIMLAGWTIVDTTIKLLTGSNLGMWNEVECAAGEFGVGTPETTLTLETATLQLLPGQSIEIGGTDYTNASCADIEQDIVTVSNVFGGHSVQVHKDFADSVRRVDAAWRRLQGTDRYEVYSIGGYVCRNTASGSRSYHSFGAAIDINPADNPHCPDWCGGDPGLQTDMPVAFREIWKAEGWGWGGEWTHSKDAMHFSKATAERGDTVIVK